MLEKSCRKEAKFDLDFKRRVREGRACRAEGGHNGGVQEQEDFLGRKQYSPITVKRPSDRVASSSSTC